MRRKNFKRLRVFYGFTKIKEKSARKAELVVVFENDNNNIEKNDRWIKMMFHVVHVRYQNHGEVDDSKGSVRMFSKYGYFIDERPWNGNIDRVLDQNFKADENNVSLHEREDIRDKLRAEFFKFYNRKEQCQLTLFKFA